MGIGIWILGAEYKICMLLTYIYICSILINLHLYNKIQYFETSILFYMDMEYGYARENDNFPKENVSFIIVSKSDTAQL